MAVHKAASPARSLSPTRTIFDSLEGTRDGSKERGTQTEREWKARGLGGGKEAGRGGPTYEKFMPTERNKQAKAAVANARGSEEGREGRANGRAFLNRLDDDHTRPRRP